MKRIITIILCISLSLSAMSQSMYGYLGKRIYASASLATSPALFHRNTDGDWAGLRFNFIGSLSGNIVLNKKQVLTLNYKRFTGVASVQSAGEGLFYRQTLGGSPAFDIGDYRFTSNEIGISTSFFNENLDAPLGRYLTFGFGMVFSKYNLSFQSLSNIDGSYITPSLLTYDNTKSIKSPMLRFGIGNQNVFWNRFLFKYGVDFGLNLAYFSSQFSTPSSTYGYSGYEADLTQEEFEFYSKRAIQNRVLMMNLVNFKMGLSYLIF